MSNDNNELKAELQEMEFAYLKLRRAFNELLDEHLELKARAGFEQFHEENQYYWVDRAGLTDTL